MPLPIIFLSLSLIGFLAMAQSRMTFQLPVNNFSFNSRSYPRVSFRFVGGDFITIHKASVVCLHFDGRQNMLDLIQFSNFVLRQGWNLVSCPFGETLNERQAADESGMFLEKSSSWNLAQSRAEDFPFLQLITIQVSGRDANALYFFSIFSVSLYTHPKRDSPNDFIYDRQYKSCLIV